MSFLRDGDDLRRMHNLNGFVLPPQEVAREVGARGLGPASEPPPSLGRPAACPPSGSGRRPQRALLPGPLGRARREGGQGRRRPGLLPPGPCAPTLNPRAGTPGHWAPLSQRAVIAEPELRVPTQVNAARRHGPRSGVRRQLLAQRLRGLHHFPRPALHSRVCEWRVRPRRRGAGWAVRTRAASCACPGSIRGAGPGC